MIIGIDNWAYRMRWRDAGANRWNGAYYYAKEIEENIIPRITTDRNWILVNVPNVGCDHAIVFIHNNLHPEHYEWLKKYKDLVLVCGVPEMVDKVQHIGKAIYLPLSVNVEYIKKYKKKEHLKKAAFAGRPGKDKLGDLPDDIDMLQGIPRDKLLRLMADYKTVYAVGRCAIEAKVLGCRLKAYDKRYPKTSAWKILDNKDAAKILQKKLDEIDGKAVCEEIL